MLMLYVKENVIGSFTILVILSISRGQDPHPLPAVKTAPAVQGDHPVPGADVGGQRAGSYNYYVYIYGEIIIFASITYYCRAYMCMHIYIYIYAYIVAFQHDRLALQPTIL